MKKLFYLFILFTFFSFSNVYALDYNVSSQVTSPVAPSTAGTYTGEEVNGATSSWNINTRYQGTLQRIRYNIPLPTGWLDGQCFAINNTYTITMNMATNDWRNYFGTVRVVPYSSYSGNWSNGRVNFISRKKISFTFTIPDSYTSCVDFLYVDLPSSATFTAFTGETNWNLSSIILTDPMYTSGSGSGSGSSGATNQDIINNNDENTSNIINNQNTNTSDIIENNNQNTQEIIKSNQICNYNLVNLSNYEIGTIMADSGLNSSSTNRIRSTDYIPFEPGKSYSFLINSPYAYLRVFFYDKQKNYISSYNYGTSGTDTFNVSNAVYMRLLFYKNGNASVNLDEFKSSNPFFGSPDYCMNSSYINSILDKKNSDNINNSINDVNDSINNSNVDNGVGEGFFDNFTNQDFGLSQIITIPLNTIQSLTSKTCVPLQVPIPFTNSNVSLPCMTEIYTTKFPTIYNLWKIVSFGIVAYLIAIDIFHIVKGFKDPESDKVEVLDL